MGTDSESRYSYGRFLRGLAVVPLATLAAASPAAAAEKASYVVVYRDSVKSVEGETDRQEKDKGFKAEHRYRHALKGFAADLTENQVQRLESDSDVAYVSPDRPREAFATITPGDTAPTGVRRIEAAVGTTVRGASGVNVAVVDTGIDLDHPDLNAADGTDCITPGTTAEDNNGHGTHVAGSIGARNNGSGVLGVAPGTKVYGVKVLNSAGNGSDSTIICGIDWAIATLSDGNSSNDIAVINMSLGGGGPPVQSCAQTTDPFHAAVCRATQAGIVNVVAAGNDGWDFDFVSNPDVPAAYSQTIVVTGISDSDGQPGGTGGNPPCGNDADDTYYDFSNFATLSQNFSRTIAGPGVCIQSTWLNGGHATISGTSMATPHVAGAVALCLAEGSTSGPCAGLPADEPSAFVERIRRTTPSYGFLGDPNQPVSGKYFGYLAWVGVPQPPPPSTYRDAVLATPGLVSYWRLGEGSGATAADEKGANPGSYAGGPMLGQPGAIVGDSNTAVRFDGSNDEMTAAGPGLSSQGSIEGWFYWEAGLTLMRDHTTATGAGWLLAFDSGGNLAYRVGGTTFLTGRSTASVRNGWHHVVLTRSGGSTAFYLDGALVHQGSGAGSAAAQLPWHVMRNANTSGYSRGRADEVAIYNTALPAQTVQQHYALGQSSPPPPPSSYRDAVLGTAGLVSYWRLGEGSGATAADEKGANPGSYAGGPMLGQPGAIVGDSNTAVRFDGSNDEMTAAGPGLSSQGSIEGWFYWEAGLTLMRDHTTATGAGWLLAFDSGGNLAYRVGGTTFLTGRSTASVRNGWHHVVLTRSGGSTAFYLDGALVHQGSGAGSAAAQLPWHVMRNANTSGYSRGRADEVAIYNTALPAQTVQQHYDAGT